MLLHTSSRWRCRNRGAKAGAGCCHYFIPRFVVEFVLSWQFDLQNFLNCERGEIWRKSVAFVKIAT